MKTDVCQKFAGPNDSRVFFAVRLFPETNEEMAKLEWGEKMFNVKKFERIVQGDELSYVVQFEEKKV